ncbi:retrovirus-related pol polyprotein from transposon TNT 1-94 [Tanacetum coccineum]
MAWSKPVTLRLPYLTEEAVNSNKDIIAPGMYKVVTTHESQKNEAKHDLSSIGMNAASSVRRPMNRDSHVKDSVLANSKKPARRVAFFCISTSFKLLKMRLSKMEEFGTTYRKTLVEAARTMLIFSRLPKFLWAEAVATACFTQNRSIIYTRHNKAPYELLQDRKTNVEYFHVFGSLCYPTNNQDDLRKMKPKEDIGVFIGYSETSRGFRIYNRRTKKNMETINVRFDKLTAMASEHNCLEPELQQFINYNSSAEEMYTP